MLIGNLHIVGGKRFFRFLRSRSPARGMTLLESVIALTLLGIVVLGAFGLLVSSYAAMRHTQESLYVTRLLETAVEMTRNLSYNDIAGDPSGSPAGFASVSPVVFSTDSTLLKGANGEILYGKGVAESSDPAAEMELVNGTGKIYFQQINSDLYRVTAEVTYRTFNRRLLTRSVTTYVARQGINRR